MRSASALPSDNTNSSNISMFDWCYQNSLSAFVLRRHVEIASGAVQAYYEALNLPLRADSFMRQKGQPKEKGFLEAVFLPCCR